MTQPDPPDHDEQQLGVEVDANQPSPRLLPLRPRQDLVYSPSRFTALSFPLLDCYHETFGLAVIHIRKPTVYPPAQRPSLAVATLSQRLQFNHTLPMGNRDHVF